ncbi:hypothetical protein SAMN04488548_1343472 [Gordonia westfalica]|uniref:Uncharacterized protein n=1 Tax=Gordonia westfalica TaxID=158898 RepID=A0A1H2KNM5_9ACTN|nr:hypothetical protein SAMN04488548_1343472 [Gordonia westfalica]
MKDSYTHYNNPVLHGPIEPALLSDVTGRPLSTNEHDLIQAMIAVLPPKIADQLGRQLETAHTNDSPSSLQLSLATSDDVEPTDIKDGPIDVVARVFVNGDYQGELLVFVTAGKLSLLEYARVTDTKPTTLPHLESVQIEPV